MDLARHRGPRRHRPRPGTPAGPGRLAAPGATAVPLEGAYTRLAALGYAYGPAFQGLRACWRDGEEIWAEAVLPGAEPQQGTGFALHPALLDAALHALLPLDGTPAAPGWPSASAASGCTPRERAPCGRTSAPRPRRRGHRRPDRPLGRRRGDHRGARPAPGRPAAAPGRGDLPGPLWHLEWVPLHDAGAPAAPGDWALIGEPAATPGAFARHYLDLAALQAALTDGEAAPEAVALHLTGATGDAGDTRDEDTPQVLGTTETPETPSPAPTAPPSTRWPWSRHGSPTTG
ncbi:polyketide synthase dehydratase domain-containing protein [Streptomyces zhihengii]